MLPAGAVSFRFKAVPDVYDPFNALGLASVPLSPADTDTLYFAAAASIMDVALKTGASLGFAPSVGSALADSVGSALAVSVGSTLVSSVGSALASPAGSVLAVTVGSALAPSVGSALAVSVGSALAVPSGPGADADSCGLNVADPLTAADSSANAPPGSAVNSSANTMTTANTFFFI